MKKSSILIVTAHPDDEVLGVGGTILKHTKAGDEVSVLILADGESSRDTGADIQKRQDLAHKVSLELGVKNIFLNKLPDNKMDSIPLLEIVKKVESIVDKIKPDIIYTHCQSDLNVDHRLTFQAVLTACRPQPGFCVQKILTFETLSSTEWQVKDRSNIFCPTIYNNITDFIDEKLKILEIYKDELREWPHPRSLKGVRVLGEYRGMEVGFKYAEAFQLIRILNR